MKPTRTIAALGLALVLSTSCLGGFVWTLDYSFDATAIRLDNGGSTELTGAGNARGADLIVEDEVLSFSIDVGPGGMTIEARNRGSSPIELLLDETTFVHSDGHESPLLATTSDRRPGGHRSVDPGSKLTLSVWPEEWLDSAGYAERGPVRASSPVDGGLIVEPTPSEAEARGRSHLGRQLEIRLPVRWQEEKHSYQFRFTVVGLAPKRISWA